MFGKLEYKLFGSNRNLRRAKSVDVTTSSYLNASNTFGDEAKDSSIAAPPRRERPRSLRLRRQISLQTPPLQQLTATPETPETLDTKTSGNAATSSQLSGNKQHHQLPTDELLSSRYEHRFNIGKVIKIISESRNKKFCFLYS